MFKDPFNDFFESSKYYNSLHFFIIIICIAIHVLILSRTFILNLNS